MDWKTALQWCQQHHTGMVAIQNQDEIAHLNQVLPFHPTYYWIGIRKVEDGWMWVGTRKPLTPEAANWASGEPNNQGKGEDCVEIYIKRLRDTAMWNDEKCSKKKAALCYEASCLQSSCSENAECVETIGNFTCLCEPGFTGLRCEKAIECGVFKHPEHSFVQCDHTYGPFQFNSSCQFQCDRGYRLQGSQNLYCLTSGQWNSGPPQCQVVQCPPFNAAGGWRMNCSHPISANSYNSTCVFSCEEGFELIGSHTTQCDHTGEWTHRTPTCTAMTCDPLMAPEKGHMTCADPLGKFSFRSSCVVSCEEGYTLRGENTLTCLQTGHWSAGPPTCEVVRCDTLQSVPYGSVHCLDLVGQPSYGSSCWSQCDVGFLLMGTNVTRCTSQGTWSHKLPVCKAVQCAPLSTASGGWRMNCSHPLNTNSYNSTCVFSCEEGFELIGSHTTHCNHTGQWTHRTPTCTAVQCAPLSTASGGWRMNCSHPISANSYNSTCVFSCEEGFELIGSHTTQCDHTGEWTHRTPTCTAMTCDPLMAPEKGHMTCADPLGKFSFRSSCAVSCEEGYTLRGENTLTCLQTGHWSAGPPTCEVVRCDTLQSVPYGSVHCLDLVGQPSYGSSCWSQCDVGFLLMGTNVTRCTSQGTWSHKLPVCKAVQCAPLSTASGGWRMNCSHPLNTNSYNSTCMFSCEEGFELIGSHTTQCNHTGQWTHRTPTCTARKCPLLLSPEQGLLNCSHRHSVFSYGSRCTVACDRGYGLTGESQLDCTAAGSWSQEMPSCDAVKCEPLLLTSPAPADSSPVPSMNCTHPRAVFSFGSQCMFWCPEGYVLNGTSELICTSTGLWTQTEPLPSCVVEEMPLGTAMLVYGAIGAGSALALLIGAGLIFRLVQFTEKSKLTPYTPAWEGSLNPAFEEL
ncbi:P-selectin isoform X2 [Electrophorus electricus]|nr:P-selectin isoform X2 [Electrophorus electricus]